MAKISKTSRTGTKALKITDNQLKKNETNGNNHKSKP